MLPWETIATATSRDGGAFVLSRRGGEWMVRVNERILMTSRQFDSEVALANVAIDRAGTVRNVLVGGLGFGFTLRAVLDRIAPNASVKVAELVPALIAWNRELLGELATHPLQDERCAVVQGDVYDEIRASKSAYDVILLDVDNGPWALAQARNRRLYARSGVIACQRALRPGGIVSVWSAGPNDAFEKTLRGSGLEVSVCPVPARRGGRAQHVLFVGRKSAKS